VTAAFRDGWQWAIFSAAGGEHDDWDACDRAMARERRAAALVRPDRVCASR
jgi:hypothetical protein